jgi:4-hydroxy-2-oxoheptanedioate aldolase
MTGPAPDGVPAAWAAGRAARNGWLTVPAPHLVEVVSA